MHYLENFPLKKNKYNDKIDSREVFARLYACGEKLKKILTYFMQGKKKVQNITLKSLMGYT